MKASKRIAKQITSSVLERDTASIMTQIIRASLEREAISYRDRVRTGRPPSHSKMIDFIPDFGRDAHGLYEAAKEAPFVVSLVYDVVPFSEESDPLIEPHAYSRLKERYILPEGFSFEGNEDLRKSLSLFITRTVRSEIENDLTRSDSLLGKGKVLKFSDSDFIAYCKVFSTSFLNDSGTSYPVSVIVLPKEFDFDTESFGPYGLDRYKKRLEKRERNKKETSPKEKPTSRKGKPEAMDLAFEPLMRVYDFADIYRRKILDGKAITESEKEKVFNSLSDLLKEKPDLNVFTKHDFLTYLYKRGR